MHMAISFRPAKRTQAKLRLALAGPSGSGKTYSALLIARGLVGPEGKIAVIDTERGSASLYAHLTPFDTCELTPPFAPEKYIQAIRIAEQAGHDVIVIDSLSHAWAGPGGILDLHDAAAAKEKSSFAAWRLVTPRHNDLVDAMLQSPCHIIATMRSKQEYAQTEEGGKKKVAKLGLAPVQRDGMEYEFAVFLDLNANHHAVASKDRTSLFDGQVFRPDQETGRTLMAWLNSAAHGPASLTAQGPPPANPGVDPAPETTAPAGPAEQKAPEPEPADSAAPEPAPEVPKKNGLAGIKALPYEGQVIVAGPPEKKSRGWEAQGFDVLTDIEVTLVGPQVEGLQESQVLLVKGLRAETKSGIRVKVEELEPVSASAIPEAAVPEAAGPAPADAVAIAAGEEPAPGPAGEATWTVTLESAPKIGTRDSAGTLTKVAWAYARTPDGRRVVIAGTGDHLEVVAGLAEGQVVEVTGQMSEDSDKAVFYVRRVA